MRAKVKISQKDQSDRVADECLFVTSKQIAAAFGYTQEAVIRMMQEGRLPARKIGQGWRMHKDDFRKLTAPLLPDEPDGNSQIEADT